MVVGCVIDPEMREEIRVTVVATGIGRPVAQAQQAPGCRRMTAIAGGRGGRVPTLDDLHVPTYIRNQRDPHVQRRAVGDGLNIEDTSLLDIPAFLRRQAD